MRGIPRLNTIDSSSQFLKDPYRFISYHCKHLKSDVFETRLLLSKTICMTGKDAAQIFSNEELFMRKGAAPEPVSASLFGKGGVQGLDDEAHLHRKNMFMSFMTNNNVQELCSILKDWLEVYTAKWMHAESVVLYEEFQEILTRTVCTWAGIDLSKNDVKMRTKELTALFDSAGSPKRHLASRLARKKSEAWIEKIVREIRAGKRPELKGAPVYEIAHYRDIHNKLLKPEVAAVEILNLLRPTVAVSVYFVFSLHALHLHPESRQRLKSQETGYLDNFVNEVRRFYPFFPALTAKVRQDFKWGRMMFRKGTRVMLDIYGINHDPRIWDSPWEFRPDRFKNWNAGAFNFVPQGAGDHYVNHRCPGELFTIELMRTLVQYFVLNLTYEVPKQELQVLMDRMPALPKSRMIVSSIFRADPFLAIHTEKV